MPRLVLGAVLAAVVLVAAVLVATVLPVGVTVLGSAISSAGGAYVIRLRSPVSLAPDAANGVVRFLLMTGDRAGWDTSGFAAHLAPATAGLTLQLPSGRPVVADLNLARHTAPVMP